MKFLVKQIINSQNQIANYSNLIFEKENDILSCIKAIKEDGIENRQKQAANSLFKLQQKRKEFISLLNKQLKKLDINSFQNKKMSSFLVYKCISEGIGAEDLNILKNLYKGKFLLNNNYLK